jgi:antitoxin CptB
LARELARLRWACRRGMKELDLLLLRYLDQEFSGASARHRAAFVHLLELPDPELFGYLLGREAATEESIRDVVARIRRDTP